MRRGRVEEGIDGARNREIGKWEEKGIDESVYYINIHIPYT